MEEFNLIKNLESLKQAKPRQEWVICTKNQILSLSFEKQEARAFCWPSFSLRPRLVAVFSSFLMLVLGFSFVIAQNSVPGESLYVLKQFSEKVKIAVITSPEQKSVAQVRLAEAKLDELDKITKQSENQGKKLAASIKETKKALSKASQEISRLSGVQKAELAETIVAKIQKIENTTNAALMDESDESYQEFYKLLVENEIKELESNTNLTEEQAKLLDQAREFFAVGEYIKAWEKIYEIQPEPLK